MLAGRWRLSLYIMVNNFYSIRKASESSTDVNSTNMKNAEAEECLEGADGDEPMKVIFQQNGSEAFFFFLRSEFLSPGGK